jgi:hypothetical protein
MDEVATLVGALLFPVVGLLVLLWLGHLEDTLPRDVRAAERSPDPAPIRAVPLAITEAPPAPTVASGVVASRVVASATVKPDQAFSRSGTISLGGSTKR